MLFCTSLVALVGAPDTQPNNSPRKLQIVNTKVSEPAVSIASSPLHASVSSLTSQRQSTICELIFPTSVLAVKMNRKRLIVVLENEIYIYDISTMKLLHTIETGPNPNAVCALSSSSENSFLAYPSPAPSTAAALSSGAIPPAPPAPVTGDVLIFDTINLSAVNVIQAHKTPIAALALNAAGTMLATASDKGTVVRVFSVPDAKKLWQFRRGSSSAHIFSMNFNLASTLLAVSSDTSTIHIYRLAGGKPSADSDGGGSGGGGPVSPPVSASSGGFDEPPSLSAPSSAASSLRRRSYHLGKSLLGNAGTYLPKGMTEMWEPQRDFAYIKVRSAQTGVRTVVALSPTLPQVMVLSADGVFQAYNIDLDNGGECALLKEFNLINQDDSSANTQE